MSSESTIGVVVSKFNHEITEKLEAGALSTLNQLGIKKLRVIHVPGAVEIPLAAKELLKAGCDAVVALGCVIRGETDHYDYVCSAVERGCMDVQLQLEKPIAFGVLTTENEEQALERVGGVHGHKGSEAAHVAIEMLQILGRIRSERH